MVHVAGFRRHTITQADSKCSFARRSLVEPAGEKSRCSVWRNGLYEYQRLEGKSPLVRSSSRRRVHGDRKNFWTRLRGGVREESERGRLVAIRPHPPVFDRAFTRRRAGSGIRLLSATWRGRAARR